MIIKFEDNEHGVFQTKNFYLSLLKTLRDESPFKTSKGGVTSKLFYAWLKENWKITVIWSRDGFFTEYIVGLEMPEDTHTMLTLKYK